MKIILPVETDPPIKMLPGLAQPLSIICANYKNADVFIVNNYLQLYIDNYAGVDTQLFNSFSKKTANTFYLPNNPLLKIFEIESSTPTKNDALDTIRSEIQKGNYIFSTLNEYFIPGTCFYQTVNMFHPELIYGFDDETETLFGFVYDENPKYTAIEISYKDFNVAFDHTGSPMDGFTIYKLKKDIDFVFDSILCKNLLLDYLYSRNSFKKISNSDNIYGLNIYNYLIKVTKEQKNIMIDPRDFASLYEHIHIMCKLTKDYLKFADLAKEYETLLMLSIGIRTRAYQCYKFEGSDDLIRIMVPILIKMRNIEECILSKICMRSNITSVNNSPIICENRVVKRCYTTESKVVDYIEDDRVWEIFEKYLPGVSVASQLPLIYGMSLSKFLMMAQKFYKLTDIQAKEILQKVLDLK